MNNKTLYFILFVLILFSCNTSNKSKILGVWEKNNGKFIFDFHEDTVIFYNNIFNNQYNYHWNYSNSQIAIFDNENNEYFPISFIGDDTLCIDISNPKEKIQLLRLKDNFKKVEFDSIKRFLLKSRTFLELNDTSKYTNIISFINDSVFYFVNDLDYEKVSINYRFNNIYLPFPFNSVVKLTKFNEDTLYFDFLSGMDNKIVKGKLYKKKDNLVSYYDKIIGEWKLASNSRDKKNKEESPLITFTFKANNDYTINENSRLYNYSWSLDENVIIIKRKSTFVLFKIDSINKKELFGIYNDRREHCNDTLELIKMK